MEWHEAVEEVVPHIVQISTPRGSGSGFLVSASTAGPMCAIATAAHVVNQAQWWEEPVRLFHPHSGKSCILRMLDRAMFFNYDLDTAAIAFANTELPFPAMPISLAPEGHFFKVGNEIGWLGFPAVSPLNLCFFSGRVSAWVDQFKYYLVDGVAINGVSGGPAFSLFGPATPMLIGVVSAYIPNLSTGTPMPGLSVVRDVMQFHELVKNMRSLDEALRQQTPPQPPDFMSEQS